MLRQIINFILDKDGDAESKAYEAGFQAGKHDGYEEGRRDGFQAGLRRGKASPARVDSAPGFDSIRRPPR